MKVAASLKPTVEVQTCPADVKERTLSLGLHLSSKE